MKEEKRIDLLHGPILKSLAELALPIMATAMVQMAYNLTDMAWIGKVGSGAVTSVGAAGMFTWFSTGVVTLAKMGGQVKVAHSLGEHNQKEAVQYGKGTIQLTIVLAVFYALITNLFAGSLIGFFKLSSEQIVSDAVIYLRITCGLILFSFLNQTLTGLYTAIGNSKTPFIANCIGMLANMIFDPILILGIGPFPEMRAVGAAIATVTAQGIVTLVLMWHVRKDTILFDKIKIFEKTSFYHLKTILYIGFPAAVQNMLYSSISMVLTRFVASWGDTAVAVQRVGGQIESISWMTAEGFGAAINAFIGQNYGGKYYDRVKKGYFTATSMMVVWGLFTTAILVFCSEPIFRIFIHEPEVIPYGIDYLRIIGYGQMFMCIELLTVGALSGMGKTLRCSIISITLTSARIPLAMLLGETALGLNGIWWALTLSSVIKGIVFFFNYLGVLRKLEEKK